MNQEMTIKQKKQIRGDEFRRKYQRYWFVYWGLFFTAALSFMCGLVLPFMRDDIDVQLSWGVALVSLYYALGFLSIGEGAFNFWFDKVTDSDPDNGTQKIISGIMIFVSAVVSLSTAIATSYIIAWWMGVFDAFVTIPVWAQKYIATAIPVVLVGNVASGVLFKWVSDEALYERETNAQIRESENEALRLQAKARADYIALNAPELARQMGEIEAQDKLDALKAQINQKRIKRGQVGTVYQGTEQSRPIQNLAKTPCLNCGRGTEGLFCSDACELEHLQQNNERTRNRIADLRNNGESNAPIVSQDEPTYHPVPMSSNGRGKVNP